MQLVSNWDFLTMNIIGQQILNKDSEDSNSWPTTTSVRAINCNPRLQQYAAQ